MERDSKGRFSKKDVSVDVLFKDEIDKSYNKLKGDIKASEASLEDYRMRFIRCIQAIELKKSQVEDLKRFTLNIKDTLNQQVKEIEAIPFVKGVKLTSKGVEVDVGQIYIAFRGKEVYIGDFDIIITPKGVDIHNRNPIYVKDGGYSITMEHPHISNGDICYGGERALKVNEYFAKFELKKLVYFIYLFLKSYNQSDRYESISYWTRKGVKHKYPFKKVEVKNGTE